MYIRERIALKQNNEENMRNILKENNLDSDLEIERIMK